MVSVRIEIYIWEVIIREFFKLNFKEFFVIELLISLLKIVNLWFLLGL